MTEDGRDTVKFKTGDELRQGAKALVLLPSVIGRADASGVRWVEGEDQIESIARGLEAHLGVEYVEDEAAKILDQVLGEIGVRRVQGPAERLALMKVADWQ